MSAVTELAERVDSVGRVLLVHFPLGLDDGISSKIEGDLGGRARE